MDEEVLVYKERPRDSSTTVLPIHHRVSELANQTRVISKESRNNNLTQPPRRPVMKKTANNFLRGPQR